jgi:hypothetical protein
MSRRRLATFIVSFLILLAGCSDPGETIAETGHIFDDYTGVRLCTFMYMSMPPQCSGEVAKLDNSNGIDLHLIYAAGGDRWSPTVNVTGVMHHGDTHLPGQSGNTLLVEAVTVRE